MYLIEKETGKQIMFIDDDELLILDMNFVMIDNTGEVLDSISKKKEGD